MINRIQNILSKHNINKANIEVTSNEYFISIPFHIHKYKLDELNNLITDFKHLNPDIKIGEHPTIDNLIEATVWIKNEEQIL